MKLRNLYVTLAMLAPTLALASSNHSNMGWFGTQLVSALINGVVYGLIFKLFHGMGLVPSLILGAALLGAAYYFYQRRS